MVNDVEALIAEAKRSAAWVGEGEWPLVERLIDALEAANKRARLHAERGNGLAEELDNAYSRIVNLTRALDN